MGKCLISASFYGFASANLSFLQASLGEDIVSISVQKVTEPTAQQGIGDDLSARTKQLADEKKAPDVELQTVSTEHAVDHEAYPEPTPEERSTLRKVYDTIPLSAWTLCFVEVGERAS